MKMVKSLLLGSATGIVAVAGAQAADLPVKAKPVEYVKVCSLYGAGFYYIPGTDICLKVGGYVRAEYGYGDIGASMTNLENTGTDGQRTRLSGPDYNQRARAIATLDSRQQTEYGTLRTYMNIGFSFDIANASPATAVYANRAMVQIAGFTFGLATSFYDFYSSPATSYSVPWSSDTGDGGWKVAAYTAQFGNGVSATLSFEEPRRTSIANLAIAGAFNPVGNLPINDQEHVKAPDIVANLRVDQAWGSAQVMGAAHLVQAGYYGTAVGGNLGAAGLGHPGDKWGGAVGAGIRINAPFISPGDYLQAQVNYTIGANRYAALTPSGSGSPGLFTGGTSLGMGFFSDAVYTTGTSLELTTAWSAQAAYEHFWTPALRTSFVAAYTNVRYNDNASAIICGGAATGGNQWFALTNCGSGSFNWSHLSLSSRTQWNITKDFYIGLEGYYARLYTMSRGQTVFYTTAAGLAQPSGTRTLEDQNIWVGRFRVHRDIVP